MLNIKRHPKEFLKMCLSKFLRSECITDRKSVLFLIVSVFSANAAVDRSTCLPFLKVTLRRELSTWRLTYKEGFTAVLYLRAEVPDLIFSDRHASRFSHSCIVTSPYDKAGGTASDIIHWARCPITKQQNHHWQWPFWWRTPLAGSTSDSLLSNQDFPLIIQRFCIQSSRIPGPGTN